MEKQMPPMLTRRLDDLLTLPPVPSKTYQPNGDREVARRRRQMEKAASKEVSKAA